MGWNYRKSVNLGGGLRLNFSKSGVGISGGIKGLRVSNGPRGTRLYASIPGTGIYYTKNLSSKSKSSSENNRQNNTYSTPTTTYQYTQTVTNSYTGESRELRARTQYELNEMVRLEEERQHINEVRQRQLKQAQAKEKQVEEMNNQICQVKNEFQRIIDHTLHVDDRIDWDKQLISEKFPDFHFDEIPPKVQSVYKLNFFKSLLMDEKKFEIKETHSKELDAYENRRGKAIAKYLKEKSDFETKKNRNNGEMVYLKKHFEESDKEAVERYISIVLTKSQYPADFEHDFDIIYLKDKKTVIVNFLFPDIDDFPITEKYTYNRSTDGIEELLMTKAKALTFYSNVLYSVGIRTIHEIFESVYTDGVDVVCFNGYIASVEDENQCAFAMRSVRAQFEKLDLTASLTKIISGIDSRTISDFTGIDQITAFDN